MQPLSRAGRRQKVRSLGGRAAMLPARLHLLSGRLSYPVGSTHRGVGLLRQLLLPHPQTSFPFFELLFFAAEVPFKFLQPLKSCFNFAPAQR